MTELDSQSDAATWRRGLRRYGSGPLVALLVMAPGCRAEPAQTPAQLEPARLTRLEGQVQLPNGAALAYAAILAPDPKLAGAYLGTLDIPKQALWGVSLEQIRFLPGEHVEFELPVPGTPRWVGHFNADGSLDCRFHQAEHALPCSMREVISRPPRPAAPPLARQTPLPPFPYQVLDLRIENAAAHLMLAGTLTVPSGSGPHPAVLLVSDRGSQDRDATYGRHKPFLVLADHLTRAGIAVLRLDDRGVGSSDPGAPGATGRDEESDVRAGFQYLKRRPEIDARRVGLLGQGSGARIAVQIAASDGAVHFVVQLSLEADARAAQPALRCPVLSVSGEDFPGLNRWFQHADADAQQDYAVLDETFAPEALMRISGWISRAAQL